MKRGGKKVENLKGKKLAIGNKDWEPSIRNTEAGSQKPSTRRGQTAITEQRKPDVLGSLCD